MSHERCSTKVDTGSEFLKMSLEQETKLKRKFDALRRLYQFAYSWIIQEVGVEPTNTHWR